MVITGGTHSTCQKELQFLLVRAIEEEQLHSIESLVAQGVNVNCTILYSKTPLTHAIELNITSVAKLLVTCGADVNTPESLAHARRPLHLALSVHNYDMMEFLLQKGADVDASDGCKITPLQLACFMGDEPAVEILLSAGASVTLTDSVGRTAFHRAVEAQHYDIADLLLLKGADVSVQDNFGWTAIYQCIVFCNIYGVKYLLSRGISVNSIDIKGESPLTVACNRLHRGTVHIILSTAVDFYKRVKKIPTAELQNLLQGERECKRCEFRIVQELVNAGADLTLVQLNRLISPQLSLPYKYTILCYLVLCGAKLTPFNIHVPLISQQAKDFSVWLHEQLELQMSLQRICRMNIRRILGVKHRDIKAAVDLLSIPVKLQRFLKVMDFWQIEAKTIVNDWAFSTCPAHEI